MATYTFSQVMGKAIAFDIRADILNFDIGSAADLRITDHGRSLQLTLATDSVTLLKAGRMGSLTSSNITFSDGSKLLIGDNSNGAHDGKDNKLLGAVGDDLLIGLGGRDVLDGRNGSDTYVALGTHDGTDSFRDTGTTGFDQIVAGSSGTRIRLGESFSASESGIEQIAANGFAEVSLVGTGRGDEFDFSAMILVDLALIDGLGGSDSIIGSSGDDTIKGGGGDDYIDGGAGRDVVLYEGRLATYSISHEGGVLRVRDMARRDDGDDGTDRLRNVEVLRFLDATFAIASENHAPVAQDKAVLVLEDQIVDGNVLATDADAGAILTYALAGPAPAGLTFRADGSYTFDASSYDALAQGTSAILNLTYSANDGLASDTGALAVTVIGVNDVPVAQDTSRSVNEDASISGRVVATDADAGARLTYALVGAAPAGLTFRTDGSYTFDASSYDALAQGAAAVLNATYSASDGLASDTGALTISVIGINDAPVALDTAASVLEDSTISGNVVATDADAGATLTYALLRPAPVGLTFNADGSFTFDAGSYDFLAQGQTAVLDLSYSASDGLASDAGVLVITIIGRDEDNNAPVAQDEAVSVLEDQVVDGNVIATDADAGATLTYALVGSAPVGLTFNSDGSYSFDAGSYDFLAQDAIQLLSLSYSVSDGLASDTGALDITITGVNDAPVAQDVAASVLEDTTISGNVLATDADDGATLTYSLVGAAPTGLIFNSNGTYSFDAGSYDLLAEGATKLLGLSYTVSDGLTSDTGALDITVAGVNDAPIAQDAAASAFEDTAITGNVVATDADDGATLSYALVGLAPTGLTFNADGSYSFDAGGYDFLAQDATNLLSVSYTVSDGLSSDTGALDITITGVNDAPVAQDAAASVLEDATITGNVVATDADDGASLTYALVGLAPVGLTFNPDGSYSFDADGYDFLAQDASKLLNLSYTASDGLSFDTGALDITITGVNDAPVAQDEAVSVFEDAVVEGSVVATDADDGATLTYALVGASPTGLTFNTDGSYTFDAGSYDFLAQDETALLSLAYTASDGLASDTADLIITIVGRDEDNNAPIAQDEAVSVLEDEVVDGNVVATDADAGATLTYALIGVAPIGLTFNADGSYTFDAGSYDFLAQDAIKLLALSYTVSDGMASDTAALDITITGVNDAPVAGDAAASVLEDSTFTGNVAATDADDGAILTYALIGAATGLTFNADGSYSFNASSYDSLAQGATGVLNLEYTASDGLESDTAALTITITGVNDAPVAQDENVSVLEDQTVERNVVATDADDDAILTYALIGTATGLSFNADGSYSFDASSYDSLAQGATEVLNLEYSVSDGLESDTSALTITITGVNDAPVAQDESVSVLEDQTVDGSVVATDADDGVLLTYALIGAATGLTFNADGSYSFDASSYDSLVQGATEVVNLSYSVSDGIASGIGALDITITGVNDAPVAQDENVSVLEDQVADGSVAATDADNGSMLTYALIGAATGLTFNADGSYTFDASSYDSLAQGATEILNLEYTASDGLESDTAALTITITGVNDAPVAEDENVSVVEDQVVDGSVAATDADNGAILTYALIGTATGLAFNADGSYTFDASSYDALVQGATEVLNLSYSVSDGIASDIGALDITITGVNDAPVAQDEAVSVAEDEVVDGDVVATDADDGAILTYALTGAATGLTFNGDGSYTFDASSYDSLAQDATKLLSLSYTVTDGLASDSAALDITITGVNDAPEAQDAAASVVEDTILDGSVIANDVDQGNALTYALETLAPAGLTFHSDGSYTFDANSYDFLAQDATRLLSLSYTVSDGIASDSGAFDITITGVNDAPVAQDETVSVFEDEVVDGTVVATDADDGAILSYALIGLAPLGLTFNADGSYSFDAGSYDFLAQGQTAVLDLSYTASDGLASDTADLVITITGRDENNNAPIAQDAAATVDEDAATSGNVIALDADAGATLTYALVHAAPEGLVFNADGSYTFDAADYDFLSQDEQLALSVPFTASDGIDTSEAATLLITITGINDVPVAQDQAASVLEDEVVDGTVVATDADAGATLTYALVDAAPEGLVFNADGSYTFDAADYDFLSQDEGLALSVPFTATDGIDTSEAATLLITITGINDVPVAQDEVTSLLEDDGVDGTLVATDADAGATLSYALVHAAPVGFVLNADGRYTFDAADYDFLSQDEQLALSVLFTASDGIDTSEAATLLITITGINDVPVAQDEVASLLEDEVVDGTLVATDADEGEAATLGYELLDAAPDGLVFNADGSYTFDAAAYDFLAQGEELALSIPFRANDDFGASELADLLITVTGVNDVPVAQNAAAAVDEGGIVEGIVVAADEDDGETATLTFALAGVAPAGLTFNPDGSYSFDASDYGFLAAGAQLVLTVPFVASDALSTSEAADLVITVNGQAGGNNNAPVAVDDAANATEDGAPVLIDVLANDTDADAGDTKTVSRVQPSDAFRGSVSIAAGGTAVLYAVGAAFQELGAGAIGIDTFSYTMADAAGEESTANVTVTVTGVNDAPVAVADAVSILEDAAPTTIDVLANDTDVDALDSANVIAVDVTGLQGTLTIADDGSAVIYTVAEVFQLLQVGEFAFETFSYTMTDSAGAQATATVTITVRGENEEVIVVNPPDPPAGAILGTGGDDEISGGDGNDVIYSLAGIDIVSGGAGSDTLFGGEGDDEMDGGAGNDVLSGGEGADTLLGGAGADIFIFYRVGESNLDDRLRPEADRIDEFSRPENDKIDLTNIDASTVLAGNNAFTVVPLFTQHAGELVLTDEDGDRGRRFLVEGDINGDGRADLVMEVRMADDTVGLIASDFLL